MNSRRKATYRITHLFGTILLVALSIAGFLSGIWSAIAIGIWCIFTLSWIATCTADGQKQPFVMAFCAGNVWFKLILQLNVISLDRLLLKYTDATQSLFELTAVIAHTSNIFAVLCGLAIAIYRDWRFRIKVNLPAVKSTSLNIQDISQNAIACDISTAHKITAKHSEMNRDHLPLLLCLLIAYMALSVSAFVYESCSMLAIAYWSAATLSFTVVAVGATTPTSVLLRGFLGGCLWLVLALYMGVFYLEGVLYSFFVERGISDSHAAWLVTHTIQVTATAVGFVVAAYCRRRYRKPREGDLQ